MKQERTFENILLRLYICNSNVKKIKNIYFRQIQFRVMLKLIWHISE